MNETMGPTYFQIMKRDQVHKNSNAITRTSSLIQVLNLAPFKKQSPLKSEASQERLHQLPCDNVARSIAIQIPIKR